MCLKQCFFLTDIQEFYRYTLVDDSKSTENKTEETLKLAERWQSHPPPVPSEVTDLAQKSLDGMVCLHSLNHLCMHVEFVLCVPIMSLQCHV